MSKIMRFAFLLAASAALAFTAGAQQRGAGVAESARRARVAAPAAPSGARVSHPTPTTGLAAHPHHGAPLAVHGTGSTHHASGTANANSTTETTAAPQNATPNVVVVPADSGVTLQDLTNQAPGLGFDYEHLAAISGNLAEKALIDPATMEELALAERFNRGGGAHPRTFWRRLWLRWRGSAGGQRRCADPQDVSSTRDPRAAARSADHHPAAASTAGSPRLHELRQRRQLAPRSRRPRLCDLPEASDFLLVLKNGAMVSAVAFTRQGDQLIYVTKEGNRRTMAVATIDSDATSKINAARGTPLKLSI